MVFRTSGGSPGIRRRLEAIDGPAGLLRAFRTNDGRAAPPGFQDPLRRRRLPVEWPELAICNHDHAARGGQPVERLSPGCGLEAGLLPDLRHLYAEPATEAGRRPRNSMDR